MIEQRQLIINAQLATPQGQQQGDILIRGEWIEAVGPGLKGQFPDIQTIDASGLLIMPGAIDTQVHFRWPGLTHKEDLASGSAAALMGGVTTYLEMPNTKPSTTTAETLEQKVTQGVRDSRVDFGFFMGATRHNLKELLKVNALPGCCGIKIFFGSSTGDLLLDDLEAIEAIFAQTNCVIAIHSEDESILQRDIKIRDQATTVLQHEVWRSVESAVSSTQKILSLAKKINRKVHILHVTTKEEMTLLAQYRQWATVEVTPQHLTLYSPDCYRRLGTLVQMNPPIRTKDHQDGLWAGVANNTVDVIGSDHAPHTREEKSQSYPRTPSGMPGVQTILPVMLHHHLQGRLTLSRMVDLLCHNPAKLYQLNDRGQIAPEKLASLVAIDLKGSTLVDDVEQLSKAGYTPYHGMTLNGRIAWVMQRGILAVQDNKIIAPCSGRPIAPLSMRQLHSSERK